MVSKWCQRGLLFWSIQEDAEDIAVEDPDLSVDVASRSPYGLQYWKIFVGFADPGVGVFATVSSWVDFASHVCEFLNVL